MAAGGRRRLWRWLVAAAAGAATLTACTGSGYSYVKSSSTRTYFKLPVRWRLYSREDFINSEGAASLPKDFKDRYPFFVFFDGSKSPSIRHDLSTATEPFGLAQVRRLTLDEHDTFSLQALRNVVIKVDELSKTPGTSVDVLESPKAIQLPHGVHGEKLVYTVRPPDGSTFSVLQIGMTDPSSNTVWFLLLGCESKCFTANRRHIDAVADSWTIREK
ncbi:MAG: hypothetical protein JWO37_1986 [Acidimicrobiales bacterium]|jgi:hypothetical protein|nr:hypothetical protein [Acidimicrobiales bacterium]